MTEAFYIGAYWGPRGESVENVARRFSDFLDVLAAVDPLLTSWFRTAGSRKAALGRQVGTDVEPLKELLLSGQPRRDDAARSAMTELGYAAEIWNGRDAHVSLRVRCGSAAVMPGLPSNVFVMRLPPATGDAVSLYRQDVARTLVRAVVTAWEPAWSTWTTSRLRKAQEPRQDDVVVGWATYLANRDNLRADRLPAGVIAEPLGTGVLLLVDGAADSASEAVVSATRSALRIP